MPEKLKPSTLTFGPSEEAIRELLNKPAIPKMSYPSILDEGIPQVQHAPMFRKNAFPLVVGKPETARLVESLLNIAPELRGTFRKIQVGPSEDVMPQLINSGFNADEFPITNLLGTTNLKTRNISLNPRLEDEKSNQFMIETLLHELTHAGGYGETYAYPMQENAPKQLIRNQR